MVSLGCFYIAIGRSQSVSPGGKQFCFTKWTEAVKAYFVHYREKQYKFCITLINRQTYISLPIRHRLCNKVYTKHYLTMNNKCIYRVWWILKTTRICYVQNDSVHTHWTYLIVCNLFSTLATSFPNPQFLLKLC